MKNRYDWLIVGAGITGATFANIMRSRGKSCLVIDKRDHTAGNCFDEYNKDTLVSKYGGHYFHTNSDDIYNFIVNKVKFFQYQFQAVAEYNTRIYSIPVNLHTIYKVFNVSTPEDARKIVDADKIKFDNPSNFEEKALSEIGSTLYYLLFYGYTKKHWGVDPSKLPASTFSRLPIRYTFDTRYFNDKYQIMPLLGYTNLVSSLLDGIPVKLNTKFEHDLENIVDNIFYTGSIDEYFDFRFGNLPYRGVEHAYSKEDIGVAMKTFTSESVSYTRKFSYSYPYNSNEIITATETPNNKSKAYPIRTKENTDLYNQYRQIQTKTIFGGRLGTYQYLNMDQAIAQAIQLAKEYG